MASAGVGEVVGKEIGQRMEDFALEFLNIAERNFT